MITTVALMPPGAGGMPASCPWPPDCEGCSANGTGGGGCGNAQGVPIDGITNQPDNLCYDELPVVDP